MNHFSMMAYVILSSTRIVERAAGKLVDFFINQVFRRKKLVIRLANAGGLAGWLAEWRAGGTSLIWNLVTQGGDVIRVQPKQFKIPHNIMKKVDYVGCQGFLEALLPNLYGRGRGLILHCPQAVPKRNRTASCVKRSFRFDGIVVIL
ncbi:hypothetical protein DPMN_010103 [Dreissena polymorpha]|uniref:Uncharacterized protein n=1 Tax=Dreissena polymorpha TaxID=45954 RepID=A0A9D4MY67_DREPO|nr:hypothetical protein DPMN_010103 [Dreissena polymorpha]